jgi:hypothetical protein
MYKNNYHKLFISYPLIAGQVRKIPSQTFRADDFLLQTDDFLFRTDDFLFRTDDFLLQTDDFLFWEYFLKTCLFSKKALPLQKIY